MAETIPVEIEVWRNLTTGEDYLDGQARTKLEAAKARHMGLLTLDGIPHTTSP